MIDIFWNLSNNVSHGNLRLNLIDSPAPILSLCLKVSAPDIWQFIISLTRLPKGQYESLALPECMNVDFQLCDFNATGLLLPESCFFNLKLLKSMLVSVNIFFCLAVSWICKLIFADTGKYYYGSLPNEQSWTSICWTLLLIISFFLLILN